jgi:hypothetical protein
MKIDLTVDNIRILEKAAFPDGHDGSIKLILESSGIGYFDVQVRQYEKAIRIYPDGGVFNYCIFDDGISFLSKEIKNFIKENYI